MGSTRRGWRPSSPPEHGDEVETRAADEIKGLAAVGRKKAALVGHSSSGAGLRTIAGTDPRSGEKFVSLAAAGLSARITSPDRPSPVPLLTNADARSVCALPAASARLLAVREPLPAIGLSVACDTDGMVRGPAPPDALQAQRSAGVHSPANPPPTRADLKVPRLGMFAPPPVERKRPWSWSLRPAAPAGWDARVPRLLQGCSDGIAKCAEQPPGRPPPAGP
jgi:hypothetical protein